MRWGSHVCEWGTAHHQTVRAAEWSLLESMRCSVGQNYGPFQWMREWVSFSRATAWNMVQQWGEQNVLFCNSSIYTCFEAPLALTPHLHSLTMLNLCSSLPWIFFNSIHPPPLPGWEYPWCTPVIGRFNVWTPSLHDPCIRPEKWNKVNERLDVIWKPNFYFEFFIARGFIQTFAGETDVSLFGSNWLCSSL